MANQLPMMNEREFEALKKSIARDGLQVPILLSMKGHVIDGRNRLKACHETGIEPRFINLNDYLKEYQDYVFKFDIYNHENTTGLAVALDKNEEAIIPELIKILNINRRHLTEFEKYERLGAFNDFANIGAAGHVKISKCADSAHLEVEEPSQDEPPSEPEPAPVPKPVVTNQQAAKELDISTGKLKQIKHIDKHADPEIKEQLRSDKISVDAAYKKVREKTQPKPETPPQQQEPPQQPEVEQQAVSHYSEEKELITEHLIKIDRICNKLQTETNAIVENLKTIPKEEFSVYNTDAVLSTFKEIYSDIGFILDYFNIKPKQNDNKK